MKRSESQLKPLFQAGNYENQRQALCVAPDAARFFKRVSGREGAHY